MNIIDEKLIITAWNETESIKGVSEKLNISWVRVVKTLSSNGIICHDNHRKIMELHKKGFSVDYISKQLSLSKRTVEVYLPRKRPMYMSVNSSKNAVNIRKWRNNKIVGK